jgi:hypothetical protein
MNESNIRWKRPWELTLTELAQYELARYKTEVETGKPYSIVYDPNFKKNLVKRKKELSILSPKQQLNAMKKHWAAYHRSKIELALEYGETFPIEVMEDYTDLKTSSK